MHKHILVTTLGTTWAVVPEVYGIFTNLYPTQGSSSVSLESPRHLKSGSSRYVTPTPPDEVWIITTLSAWKQAEAQLREWADLVKTRLEVYLHPDDDLATEHDVRAMRELIFRVVLKASENCHELSCSLAGGRKTMSADMQEAARTFGCTRLLHVLSNGHPKDWPPSLREPTPDYFTQPLPKETQPYLVPVQLAGSEREELLDVRWQEHPSIHSTRFPVKADVAQNKVANASSLSHQPHDTRKLEACATLLIDELAARRSDAGLLSNFIAAIEVDERHENWRSLYRLPPRIIQRLRDTPLASTHQKFLRALPKAELHCHIGGILDLPKQRTVALVIWHSLTAAEQTQAQAHIESIDWNTETPTWQVPLKTGNRAANIAAVFQHFDDSDIEAILFPAHTQRTALKTRHPLGFEAYELPGELSGSAVLSHPAAIEPTVRGILDYCKAEGIRYLELRGSPQKYEPDAPEQWLKTFYAQVQAQNPDDQPSIRFIWIADRRQPKKLPALVSTTARVRAEMPKFLVGLDLAGDEGNNPPEALPAAIAQHFIPAFRACLPITIHAGEGESAQNIWEAAYHLHADRIGHGLTLAEHPQLLNRFIDRKICLELCPTSNREVVGYHDPAHPESADCPNYPLQQLWQAGIPLTLCTDNPGISRTTLTDEYLTASRMVKGISLWDCLAMIKQAYLHAYADAHTREKLLKQVDHEIHQHILNNVNNVAQDSSL